MFRTLVVVLFLAFSFNTFAQSTYEFLNLDQSPRAAALAGSFVANIDDPNVVFYNPAGIYNLKNSPASFSFTKHLVEINSASLTYSQEVSDLGRFAAAVQYINYGDFTEADEFGNKTGNFGAGELAMMIGYANQLGENFNYGANVKFIYSGIADQSSSGVALDLGLQYVLLESGWSFGFSVLNLGSQMSTYFDKSEDLPLDMKLGFSKKMAKVPLPFTVHLTELMKNRTILLIDLNYFLLVVNSVLVNQYKLELVTTITKEKNINWPLQLLV